MNIYDINGNIRCVVQKFSYNDTFMGETFLTMDIESPNAIPFEIGDNCSYRGDIFTLNYVPSVEKTASANSSGDAFKYASVKMNSVADELTRCRMLDIVPDDMNVVWTGLPEFSFYAQTVNDLARRLQANLDSLYKDDKKWTVTTNIANLVDYNGVLCSISGKKPIDSVMSISDKSCMEILAECWNTFRVTYIIRGRTITIAPTPIEVGATFGYGKGQGLYGLQQQTKQDAQIITRLYVYGSTRNIGNHYYANLTGKGKGTIDSAVSSLETERLSFDAATGIIHDGTVNLTLGGVTHNIPMTTSLNVANAVRDHIYDLRTTEFPSWTLTKGDANSVVRVDFSIVGKYIYVNAGSRLTIEFQGQTLYIQFAHEFSFSVSSFVSLISNKFVDANDSGGDVPQNWSVVNYVNGDTHLDFKCNTAGPRRNAEITLNNITGLGVTPTLKEKGALYLDFKANSGGGRLETPTINANGTGLVASVFTSTYGLYPYGTGSNLYYFTLDFAYGTKYYKESTTQNGATQYIVKFKAGDIEVNGYIELDDTHVVGIVYQSEPNSAAFYSAISAMKSATYIYITSGLYLDLLSSEYVSYNETISGNLAVNRLMLPDFPLVHNSPNDVYLDSPNISKYGIRQGYVIFDGSDASKPEIYPTIHQMTAKNVIDSGITLSLDSAEEKDMSAIRLDKIKGVIMPTDGTKDGNIPTSVDYNYNSWQTTFTIFLKDLGFDLSQISGDKYYYATSDKMSISMISGTCAGREFQIDSIKRNTDLGYLRYELVCERSQDTNINKVYPYDSYPVSAGDEFVILNCRLPKVYVDANAQKLKDYGQAYLAKNDKTKYTYSPKVDEIWMDKHPEIANSIKAGDIFDFSDADLDLNVKSFIHTLSIKVGDKILPSYDITLDEEVESNTIQKIQNQINNISLATYSSTNITDVQQAIANYGNDYFVSKNNDDTISGNISFKQDISVRGKSVLQSTSASDLKVGNLSVGKIPCNTTNGLVDSPLYTDGTNVTSSVNVTAPTFIGELQGNAATATKLKTARTIWGQSFDGSGNVSGRLSLDESSVYWKEPRYGDQFAIVPSFNDINDANILCFQSAVGDFGTTPSLSTKMVITGLSGNVGIGTTTPSYKLDVAGTFNASGAARLSDNVYVRGDTTLNGALHAVGVSTFDNLATANGGIVSTTINASGAATFGGNVGIGTTNPLYKLDVNGTLHAADAVTLSSTLTAAGLITANGGTHTTNLHATDNSVFDGTVTIAGLLSANGGTHTTALTATALSTLAATDILGDAQLSARVMSPDYVSQTTGWGITRAGAADFRNIYADELRVQAFTADISQALAGSDYLTKSVSKLSANFVVPSVNSTVRIIVDDIEGMPATQCFTNGDYIRFRIINRTVGLTVANAWGTVTLDTTFGTNGFLNGTQAYTFTCKATTGAGLTVFKGSEVLDYGTSGSGMISRTTLDAHGSPYEQIATWVTDPSNGNNYTVHARLGNLGGIANCNGYGLYTDNAFLTKSILIGDLTKTGNYLSFDTVNGLQIKLGSTSVATTSNVSDAQTAAQNYATINCVKTDASNAPTTILNSHVSIGSDGTLNNAGGGKVTIGGLGYSGDLNATNGAPSGTYVGSTLAQTVESNAANALSNAAKAQSTADGKITTFYQTSEPTTGMSEGDIWFDTDDNNKIYIYQSNSWTLARDSGIAQAINAASSAQTTANTGVSNASAAQSTANSASSAASAAQTTANRKVETYFSTTQPTATTVGDLWYNTTTALLKRWDGSTWITVSNGYTNTNQLTDGANLGGTATWNGVSGSGKPSDNATVGAPSGTYVGSTLAQTIESKANNAVDNGTYTTYINAESGRIDARISQQLVSGGSIYTAASLTLDGNGISLFGKSVDISSATVFNSVVKTTDYNGNTIASLINQTATTVAIQASKINLVGAVTISAIDKSSVTPSALGAATPTDVNTAVNGIQVGGRNLLLNSKGRFQPQANSIDNYYVYPSTTIYLENGKQYILSGTTNGVFTNSHINTVDSNNCVIWIVSDIINNRGLNIKVSDGTTGTTGTIFTWNYPTDTYCLRVNGYHADNSTYAEYIKIEEGNKKTDWSPAPEDVDASISTAQSTADAALTRNNTMAVKLGYTDYNALASAASLGHTLMVGGMINTVLINATAVVTNGLTANCITSNMISAGSVTADKLATNVLSVGNISGLGSLATQNSLAYDGSYITNKPTSLSAINTTEGTKLGGIAAGATVGATWGTNVAGIPTNLSSLTGTEGIKNTLITISANGTLSGAGGGQVTVSGIGACTPTQAQGYATTSQNSAQDNLATKLGYTNYSDLVTKAASTDFGTLVVGGYLNTALIQAQAISTNMLAAGSIIADKIAANTITADQINVNNVSAEIANVISLDANRITTGTLSADRIDVANVVAKGLAAQTIDAQSATISNLNVVNATVNGYFHAEYSGGAFVRMGQPTSPNILDIRADGLTGIRIGVYGDNSTGLSITANGNSSTALNIHGSNYLITRQLAVPEGTWINGLSLCRVTITSGGDLGSGSLGWYQNNGYYMPNFIVSKASSNISVYIPSDMPDGAVLIFRNAGGGTINISSRNFADKFQWGAQRNDWSKPYSPVVPGALCIMVYDKSSHTWYSHSIS